MGNLCCCFHIRDPEEDVSTCQNCTCLSCNIHTFFGKDTAIFRKEQSHALTSSSQATAPLSSDAASNNIKSNKIVTSAPRILCSDIADATGSSQKQDGQIRKHENDLIDMENDSKGNKSTALQYEGRSTENCTELQLKFSSEKSEAEVVRACELSEDEEEVCPTCLEEYIPENPKIVLQCSHSYHLSCIYEWTKRSENCPICDKMMIFDEATCHLIT